MFRDQRVLAVIPARGGSKGIPLKNLRCIGGRSLVAWASDVVSQCDWIDRAVVSTDHDGIAAEAEAHGLAAPFRRPESLGGDRIGDWDVLHHALTTMEVQDACRYDIVLMLQPTSPFRRPEHLRATVETLLTGAYQATTTENTEDTEADSSHHEQGTRNKEQGTRNEAHETPFDAVWTVSPTDTKAHPLKQLTVEPGTGALEYYDPRGREIIARQQLETLYHRNGVAYAITRACLEEKKSIRGDRCGSVVIDELLVNIDTEIDLLWADFLLDQDKLTG